MRLSECFHVHTRDNFTRTQNFEGICTLYIYIHMSSQNSRTIWISKPPPLPFPSLFKFDPPTLCSLLLVSRFLLIIERVRCSYILDARYSIKQPTLHWCYAIYIQLTLKSCISEVSQRMRCCYNAPKCAKLSLCYVAWNFSGARKILCILYSPEKFLGIPRERKRSRM